MADIRYTLLTDGPSDRALLPLLTWLLRVNHVNFPIQPEWADLRRLQYPPRSLADRIRVSLDLYPCDLLFVHRDAERESPDNRRQEIQTALDEISHTDLAPPMVCVVPIRMQEAWFLFHENAIRQAAGNPNGTTPLELPALRMVEQIPDPKTVLHNLLQKASGLSGRRLKNFHASQSAIRLTDFIEDYTPLRILRAFQSLEQDVANLVRNSGWDNHQNT
jgi:hypothetical protein